MQRLATSDPAIAANTRLPDPYPPDGARQWIARAVPRHVRGEEYSFVILNAEGAVVGATGLIMHGESTCEDGREAELGYWIGRPYWGRGYATEGARQAVAFGCREAGAAHVTAQALASNAASRHVLERLGFALAGERVGGCASFRPGVLVGHYRRTCGATG